MKFSEKVKKSLSKIGAAITGIGVTAATSVTAWAADNEGAADAASEVLNSVKSGMNSANSGVVDLLKIAVPIIIGIVVAVVVAKAGIGWVKNIGSKAK